MKNITKALMALLMLAGTLFSVQAVSAAPSYTPSTNDIAEVNDWYIETGVASGGDTQGVLYWAERFDSHNERCNYGASHLTNTAWDMRSFLVGRGMDAQSIDTQIDWAYGVVLSRAPDFSGRLFWRDFLTNQGGSWHDMVNNMTWSTEYFNVKVKNPGYTWDYDIGPCSFN